MSDELSARDARAFARWESRSGSWMASALRPLQFLTREAQRRKREAATFLETRLREMEQQQADLRDQLSDHCQAAQEERAFAAAEIERLRNMYAHLAVQLLKHEQQQETLYEQISDYLRTANDERAAATAEQERLRNMYTHLAVQLNKHEERQDRTAIDHGGAIRGLQMLADDQKQASQQTDARMSHVERLYGNLVDELPKYVQPLLDFRSESVAILNRFRIHSDEMDDVREKVATWSSAIERLAEGLSQVRDQAERDSVRLTEEIAAVRQTADTDRQAFDQLESRLGGLSEDGVTGRVSQIREEVFSRVAGLDETLARLTDDVNAAARNAEQAERLHAELAKQLGGLDDEATFADRLAHAHAEITARIGGIDGELKAVAAEAERLNSEVSNRLAEAAVATVRLESEVNPTLERLDALVRAAGDGLGELKRHVGSLRQDIDRSSIVIESVEDGVAMINRLDLIGRLVHESGAWDAHVVDVMRRFAHRRGKVAIDVGAHCGFMTLAMARRFERVLSFEPNDVSYRLLSANVTLNGLTNVTLFNQPLFSRPIDLALGDLELQETPVPQTASGLDMQNASNPGSLFFLPVGKQGQTHFRHQALTLDSLDLDALDFLKIDVQGADGEVMLGGAAVIERFKPVIVFEWEDHLSANFTVSLRDVHNLLGGIGYEVSVLKVHNEKQRDFIAVPVDL